VQAYLTAWRAWLGMLVGRDWMAGVVDLLAMIVSTRGSSSWHLIRMPFLGCVLVVASCSAHIASETAAALLVRSASIRTGGAGQAYGLNVAVSSVEARNVEFDIKVGDQPKP